MALRPEFVDHHIADWEQKLTSPYYPHRKHWPAHLFHHSPIENAVAILRDGRLRSRNDVNNTQPRDVAAPGVIDARQYAHDRVRIYFRPKTPTQWHIEGIRKPGECSYGDATHAGVLIMFVLDARSVLTLPNVEFSNQNMQLGGTTPGSTEEYFSQIEFGKVYSEGSTGGDRTITDIRAAEVLPESPLPLEGCLRAICLRSEPERDTLLYLLGADREKWAGLCYVSDALKVFQKDYTFIQEIRLTPKGVVFRLNPRRDRQNIKVSIKIRNSIGVIVGDFFNNDHAPHPNPPADSWLWELPLQQGVYLVEVKLEDTLAYRSEIELGDSLF